MGLGLAILLHALLIYGMVSGLGREITKKIQQTVNVAIIDEPKPPPPPPPPPPDDTPPDPKPQARKPTTAYVPKVETAVKANPNEAAISATTESATDATTTVQPGPVSTAAPPPPPKPKPVSPRLKAGCALPRYPQRSLDNGEEGLVVFQFLIGLDGGVKDAVLVQSSGHERLDDAAKKAFQKCKFTPGLVNGSPAQAWVRQPFRWRLQ